MADLDAMVEGVRLAVDRFVHECVVVDLAPVVHGQGLRRFDEIAQAFDAWLLDTPFESGHPVQSWAIDQNSRFVAWAMFSALREHFLLKFARRMVRRFDAATGESPLYVNMELRDWVQADRRVQDGRRDAAPTVRLVDSDFAEPVTDPKPAKKGIVSFWLEACTDPEMQRQLEREAALADEITSHARRLGLGVDTMRAEIVDAKAKLVVTYKPDVFGPDASEAEMASARGCG